MTKEEKNNLEENEILEEMQEEVQAIENEEWMIDDDKLEEAQWMEGWQDTLARITADFQNYKQRVERDKKDMIFFLKSDILKKVLPRIDDLDRILLNTPEDQQKWALFDGIISIKDKLISDLDKMWIKAFESKWEEVDPNKHDVMTTVPGQKTWIIFDEFEKGYMLDDKILRHAKVVVWA